MTIIGSREQGAVPLGRLAPSLLLCAAGAVCIGSQAVAAPGSGSVDSQLIGLLCAIGALIPWTSYAVGNSRWLVRLGDVSVHDWNLLIGIVTRAQAVVLLPLAFVLSTTENDPAAWAQFAGVSIAVAVLASVAGNALRNRMSRLLPLTLVGQMILFQTLLALIYGFIGSSAYRQCSGRRVAPLGYPQLVWAGLLGWLVFGHVPDGASLAGMAIIAASGVLAATLGRAPPVKRSV